MQPTNPFDRKNILLLLILMIALSQLPLSAQSTNQEKETLQLKKEEVIQVVKQLFEGMRAGDSTMVRKTFVAKAEMYTALEKDGKAELHQGSVDDFVKAVGTPHETTWNEKIWSYKVRVDGRLASVWAAYTFYLGNQISHCGVNAFQLFHSNEGWKIIQVTDTRRKKACQTTPVTNEDGKAHINQYLDAWHQAAAQTDSTGYFGKIAKGGIYLGTDASERWTKDEFWLFAKPYFEKGKAWDFTATQRDIQISPEGRYAWFDELLDTWMGTCRGSGVLKKEGDQWMIQHYNLTLTVPNDKMNEVIKVISGIEN